MSKASINHSSLEYLDHGSGEPLVLIHGSASDHRTWQAQHAEFAQHYRVITYSRRYHWPNERISEGADYDMHEHVEDLRELLQSLGASPAHLIGHSYGALMCLQLCLEEPKLIRSMVLAEPPAITLYVSNTPKPQELLKLFISRPRTALALIKLGAMGLGPAAAAAKRDDLEEMMRLFGTAALGREAFGNLSEERKSQVRDNLIKAELLGSGFPPLDAEQLRGAQVPTLLATGQSSPAAFHRLADRLEEVLPHTERLDIPNASHIMHEDNPGAYNAAVLSFLAKHSRASQPAQKPFFSVT